MGFNEGGVQAVVDFSPPVFPGTFLPQGFKLLAADAQLAQPVSSTLAAKQVPVAAPKPKPRGTLGEALPFFAGVFSGPGFNLIFRPNNKNSGAQLLPGTAFKPDLLELNLTHELWTFPLEGRDLGEIPNRGIAQDVILRGINYTQAVRDVTGRDGKRVPVDRLGRNEARDAEITDIHFEPGLMVHVPASAPNPGTDTVSRMASIPHGTTINAQGPAAVKKAGEPDIKPTDSAPFNLSNGQRFSSKDGPFKNEFNIDTPDLKQATRLPQDLKPFNGSGAMTQAMLNDPNTLLKSHNAGKTIKETITFTVKTTPFEAPLKQQTCPYLTAATKLSDAAAKIANIDAATKTSLDDVLKVLNTAANGTANIGFLDGGGGLAPNASAAAVESTFWVSKVQYAVRVDSDWTPGLDPANRNAVRVLRPTVVPPPNVTFAADTVPVFRFPEDKPVKKGTYQVTATQIQYSQTIILNFNGLGWPHISVATLLPVEDVMITDANLIK